MYDRKSDYALNKKNKDAIVCPSVTETYVELKREDFASEEEFVTWKEWSDEEYRQEYNAGQSYKRLKKKLQNQVENIKCETSAEQMLLNALDDAEMKAFIEQIKSCLTEKQFRRLWLYYVEYKTEQEIANMEKVGQPRIVKSISSARKRIKKFLENIRNRG